ncbi:hypothetical protein CTAYLR_007458 [Chrysophaeum taylorii]|uniref:Mitochondrial carrier protein n=1 Tax=Chrysophaeum taylorii TaxID=2483200 RepID=A0AAD7XKN0_9STRA|nr:hypothetical protein CTAYLR_007458 [Chrysophaeum taylorii]
MFVVVPPPLLLLLLLLTTVRPAGSSAFGYTFGGGGGGHVRTDQQEALLPWYHHPSMEIPYFWGCAAAGAVSTAVSHSAVLPLDVLKTKMQSDVALKGLSTPRALRRIIRRDGPSQLLAGFSANAIGYFSQGALKFGLYERGKVYFSELLERRYPGIDASENRWRVPIWIASSACAEVVASLALCPMEATKIRMVTDSAYARNALGAFRRILGEEGLPALYRGVTPIMIRQVPYTVAKLAGYEALSLCFGGGLAAGVVAGALAAAVSQPGDVILSKLCGGSKVARLETCYLSAGAVVQSVSLRELFVGLTPRATMCAAICAGQFFLYEALRPPKPLLSTDDQMSVLAR